MKEYDLNERISKEMELKQEVRSDLYNTIEGVTANKAFARSVLEQNFDTLYLVFGDSKELYEAMYEKAGIETNPSGMLVGT